MDKGKPISGKQYALTGAGKSIANGNTWAESEVKEDNVLGAGTRQTEKNKTGSTDAEVYSNPDKLYQVKLLKTDKNGGFFKTLKEALSKQKEYEAKDWYATIIRVDPKSRNPLYGQDGWPIAL